MSTATSERKRQWGAKRKANATCACGCGATVCDTSSFPRRYVKGHYKPTKGLLRGPQYLSPAAQKKRNKSISVALTGTHGFGRVARDNPSHKNALHWIIRDAAGRLHEFDNLQSWCRANETLFQPDDYPHAVTPLWLRAAYGFNNMQRNDGKATHQWKGWTLVSVLERRQQGAPDLLTRAVEPSEKGNDSA